MLKRILKNEKGLTLIELLAVVVILGIIAAIAIPSIGGLIDNSKKDAHVANARQMVAAAKMAVSAVTAAQPVDHADPKFLSLHYLESQGYLETMTDPDHTTDGYTADAATAPADASTDLANYVEVTKDNDTGMFSYSVTLSNANRGITTVTAEGSLDRGDGVNK